MSACPFCDLITAGTLQAERPLVVALRDAFPISPGHTLVLPRRHEPDYFALLTEERAELWTMVDVVKAALDEEFRPGGYNLGVNVGGAAGQTIGHMHVHVIPRYTGDREDPRGGIRWIIPERARYWGDEDAAKRHGSRQGGPS